MQVSRFTPLALCAPFTALTITSHDLLPDEGGSSSSSSYSQQASAPVTITADGRLDCIVWWLEYEMAPGKVLSYAPPCFSHATADGGCSQASEEASADPDVLRPHVWQHVQYMTGSQSWPAVVRAGEQVMVTAVASESGVELNVLRQEHQQQQQNQLPLQQGAVALQPEPQQSQQQQAEEIPSTIQHSQSQGASQILPYHMSMLNDRARTQAYAVGIHAAVSECLAAAAASADSHATQGTASNDHTKSLQTTGQNQAAHQEHQQTHAENIKQQSGSPSGATACTPHEPLVVLDVGAGTGLLSMLAAVAGAPYVMACEREPVLAAVAQQLIHDNASSDVVTVACSTSKQLSVQSTADAGSVQQQPRQQMEQAPKTKQQQQLQPPSLQLPARAQLVVHEIFGTDPLSEHVLPALRDVQVWLLLIIRKCRRLL